MRKTINIDLNSTPNELNYHKFEKKNLMTISSKSGSYDEYECSCGLKARLYRLGQLEIKNISEKKFKTQCPKYIIDLNDDRFDVGKKIKIIKVKMSSSQIVDLKTNSIHKIVSPPIEYAQKYPNTEYTVWVMGKTEPVRLLTKEFEFWNE